jgi:hypothetical protein
MSFYPYLQHSNDWKITVDILNCIVQVLPAKVGGSKPMIHIRNQHIETVTTVCKNNISITEYQEIAEVPKFYFPTNNETYGETKNLEMELLANKIDPKPKSLITIYTPGLLDLEIINSSALIKTPLRKIKLTSSFGARYTIIDAAILEYNIGVNSKLHLIDAQDCFVEGTQSESTQVLLNGKCTFGTMIGAKPIYVANDSEVIFEPEEDTLIQSATTYTTDRESLITTLDKILDGTYEQDLKPDSIEEPKLLVTNFPADPF